MDHHPFFYGQSQVLNGSLMHQECVSSDINGPFPRCVIRQTSAICAAQPTPVAEAHVGHGSSADSDVWSQAGHAKDLRYPPRLPIESTRQIPCCRIFAILKQALPVERFAQDLDHRDIHATRHHVDIVPDGGVSSFLFCLRRILSGIIVTLWLSVMN